MTPAHRARSETASIGSFGWVLEEVGRKSIDFANQSVRDFGELDEPAPAPPAVPFVPLAPRPIVNPEVEPVAPPPMASHTGLYVLGAVGLAAAIGVAWAMHKRKSAGAARGARR